MRRQNRAALGYGREHTHSILSMALREFSNEMRLYGACKWDPCTEIVLPAFIASMRASDIACARVDDGSADLGDVGTETAKVSFVDDQLDVAADIRPRRREIEAQRRAGPVAADEYAEPVAGILRILGASLNGSILFAGNFRRRPRRRTRLRDQSKDHAPDDET
jgi:hypothetical protein